MTLVTTGCIGGQFDGQAGKGQKGYVPEDPRPLEAGTIKVEPGTRGKLKWEVYDTATGKLLTKGDRALKVSDFKMQRTGEVNECLIDLGEKFTLGRSGTVGGFALMGSRSGMMTFSWDWFSGDASGHATKLQEFGEVFARQSDGIVSHIEFLTDVCVRIDDLGTKDVDDYDPDTPAWRIKVFKGSVIVWPKVVDGKFFDR